MVYCEGKRTEPEYLEALKMESAIQEVAAVEINEDQLGSGAVPLTLVKWAVAEKKRSLEEDRHVDEFWCVFDVEWPKNHPNLPEALQLAHTYGIHIAISNPCFELWLALHFTHHAEWLDSNEAIKLRQSHDGSSDKGVYDQVYVSRRRKAVKRARYLDGMHDRQGTKFPRDNPSSGMYKFLDAIEGAA